MCTSIIEIARAEGMAKRGDEWFPLSQAVVAYDHARHAPLGDVITLDFINIALEPGARAGIELTLETAKELRAALDRAIAAAEFEEAEVRGKGAVAQPCSGSVTREMSHLERRPLSKRISGPTVRVGVELDLLGANVPMDEHAYLAALDKLKTRIQALRAKTTNSGCTEDEAL